jgi:hypothetical protein
LEEAVSNKLVIDKLIKLSHCPQCGDVLNTAPELDGQYHQESECLKCNNCQMGFYLYELQCRDLIGNVRFFSTRPVPEKLPDA